VEGDSTPESTEPETSSTQPNSAPSDTQKAKKGRTRKRPKKYVLTEDYIDIIKDAFWDSKPWILA
jgi:ribosome-binding protein aMBF1 (putative translation factor)